MSADRFIRKPIGGQDHGETPVIKIAQEPIPSSNDLFRLDLRGNERFRDNITPQTRSKPRLEIVADDPTNTGRTRRIA